MAKSFDIGEPITPQETVLIFGAGASIPSGGPSALDLTGHLLRTLVSIDRTDLQLSEACSYIESTKNRRILVDEIRRTLSPLEPDSGLRALPTHSWPEIYTTNFDTLIEKSYNLCNKEINIVTSDFDIQSADSSTLPRLYKIHGCISIDRSLGHQSSMILTDEDYTNFHRYRELLYDRLKSSLVSMDVLIVGHSLSDPHLRELVQNVCSLKNTIGSSRRIIVNVFDDDPIRLEAIRRMGCIVISSSLNEILINLVDQKSALNSDLFDEVILPAPLIPTVDFIDETTRIDKHDPWKLYNGRPATYQDILHDYTIRRDIESDVISRITSDKFRYISVSGNYGVGKTTLIRRIAKSLSREAFSVRFVWEHIHGLPIDIKLWIEAHERLAEMGYTGILVIDDAHELSRDLRNLANKLPEDGIDGLKLLLSVNTNAWSVAIKSRNIHSVGAELKLSQLSGGEVENLVGLVESNPQIRSLVDSDFSVLPRSKKISRLKNKCARDMYVCLKAIFSNDGLDKIILYEYDKVDESLQDIYKYTAALESFGCRVHRQMIIRMLKLQPIQIRTILDSLSGIIFEDEDLSTPGEKGIFEWSTRHHVIAQTIAKFKMADQNERFAILEDLIENINPFQRIERQTINSICSADGGIEGLMDLDKRIVLYRMLTNVAPSERLPWHRILKIFIDQERIDEAEKTIQRSEDYFRYDATVMRRKVDLGILKSRMYKEMSFNDRKAILFSAREDIYRLQSKRPDNKFIYDSIVRVEKELMIWTGDRDGVERALNLMYTAFERLLDPWLEQRHRELTRILRDTGRAAVH